MGMVPVVRPRDQRPEKEEEEGPLGSEAPTPEPREV